MKDILLKNPDIKQLSEFDLSKPICGVYFLTAGSHCVYVGQSINIMSRIGDHQKSKRGLFTKAFAMEVKEIDLNKVEAKFINNIRPKLNRTLTDHGQKRFVGENRNKAASFLLTTEEVAEFLRTSTQVIKNSRSMGLLWGRSPPEFIQIGERRIVYDLRTLITWVEDSSKGKVCGSCS